MEAGGQPHSPATSPLGSSLVPIEQRVGSDVLDGRKISSLLGYES